MGAYGIEWSQPPVCCTDGKVSHSYQQSREGIQRTLAIARGAEEENKWPGEVLHNNTLQVIWVRMLNASVINQIVNMIP